MGKVQVTIYKNIHRKLKIEQHETLKNTTMNSCAKLRI